jgi:hypothetical protein
MVLTNFCASVSNQARIIVRTHLRIPPYSAGATANVSLLVHLHTVADIQMPDVIPLVAVFQLLCEVDRFRA